MGFYSTAADVTIQDADLDQLEINASGDCLIQGGNYGDVVVHVYYPSKTATQPKYSADLSITGGCFDKDTVTVTYTDVRPAGLPKTEEKPLSSYVAEGYRLAPAGTQYLVIPDGEFVVSFDAAAAR